MPRYSPLREIYRHASDLQAVDCGRACVQMIISSLTQGPASGVVPTPAEKLAAVSLTQDAIRLREINKTDAPNGWYTHPDELIDVLQKAPELAAYPDWRLAVYKTFDELLTHITVTLKRGMPAIINLRPTDHWIVVKSVEADHNDVPLFLEMLDPVVQPVVQPNPHTYIDACHPEGSGWWEMSPDNLKKPALEPKIGSVQPNNYEGLYVGIVYGPPPLSPQRAQMLKELAARKLRRRLGPIMKPGPVERIAEELRRISALLDLPELATLVDPTPELIIRLVRDTQDSEPFYTLASHFHEELGYGFIGVFDPVDLNFWHFRFTRNHAVTRSIAQHPDKDLWWTRQHLPSLPSPYFPFLRVEEGGQVVYRRLFDDFVVTASSPMT